MLDVVRPVIIGVVALDLQAFERPQLGGELGNNTLLNLGTVVVVEIHTTESVGITLSGVVLRVVVLTIASVRGDEDDTGRSCSGTPCDGVTVGGSNVRVGIHLAAESEDVEPESEELGYVDFEVGAEADPLEVSPFHDTGVLVEVAGHEITNVVGTTLEGYGVVLDMSGAEDYLGPVGVRPAKFALRVSVVLVGTPLCNTFR